MRTLSLMLASAILVAAPAWSGLTGCATKVVETRAAHVDMPTLREVGLHAVWEQSVNLQPGERVKKAWRVGNAVYVSTSDARLVSLDAKSGKFNWSAGLGVENFDVFKPIEFKDADTSAARLMVVTRGSALTLNAETGDAVKPEARLGFSVSDDPVVVGNTLCVGAAEAFYGLFLDRPSVKHWRLPVPGDFFDSAPVAFSDSVVVASKSGHLWRVEADTGDWVWKDHKTNGPVSAGLAADSNAVYVPCLDRQVYAFSIDDGGELWEQKLEGVLDSAPMLAGTNVLVLSTGHGMYSLARVSGEIKWHSEGVTSVASTEDDAIWVGDDAGYLKNLGLEDGAERAKATVPGVQIFVNNAVDKNVILIGRDGTVASYSRTGH